MLVWSTELPMRAGKTIDDVLALASKWLTGSPHASWKQDMIPIAKDGDLCTAVNGNESVSVVIIRKDGESWGGFQYIRPEPEAEWTTEIVAHHCQNKGLVSVHIHCELGGVTPFTPKPHKPYIVRQLLVDIGRGNDGGIPITDTPLILKEADVDLAARVVRGEFGNHLPIVYASATWKNTPAINALKLSQWAAGMAHIIVEPSRVFSRVLARNTDHQNVYGGNLAIYWPKHNGMKAVLRPDSYSTPGRLAAAAANLVRRALLNCRPTEDCTWDFLKETLSGHKLESLRASGSKELSDYVQAFDDEIKAKNQHIEKLEKDAVRLRVELNKAQARAEVARTGLLNPGRERPFYSGEIRDAIIKGLEAGKNQVISGGRCRHIIDDILATNHISADENDISEKIRTTLTTCENLGREQQKTLEQLGFSFKDDGRHIELIYHDDPRYSFTMAKTGSDWRGMKNQASDILKKLFK